MAAQPQGNRPQDQCNATGQHNRQHKPDPRRVALQRASPSSRIGSDADKGRLAERHHAANAGEQDKAKSDQSINTDIIQQGHAERIEIERRRNQQKQSGKRQKAKLGLAHSSASSSTSPTESDRHNSTGSNREKTITSLKALLQKDAKLSSTPTSNAPSAVTG